LAWTAPSGGGAVASYTVQYRITGAGSWSTFATGVVSTASTATGLTASTAYDFQVFAVNSAGNGTASATANATTAIAAPGVPTALTAGTATATTMPLSWTAPASGGAVASYSVQWSPHGANTWTTVADISGTSTTISGLTASTSYDFEVEAVNAGGNSGWSSAVTASTTSGGNYALSSGFQPYGGGQTYAHGSTVQANVCDMTAAIDGSHTAPTNVYFGWSASSTVAPSSTAGMSAAQGTFSNGGHNLWYSYSVPTPSTPGTYYFWAVATDPNSNIVASAVQGSTVFSNAGSPVPFTIT
jgi:Fibronectin type III domain